MNPLTVQKRLLLAESELNRAQLTVDVAALTVGVRALMDRTRPVISVASSAAGLVEGLAAIQRHRPVKPSRLQTVLQCAGFMASLWLAYRARSSAQEK